MDRRRVVVRVVARVALALVLVVALVVAGLVGWRLLDRPSDYERAVGFLPESTLRVTYTDWAEVRVAARGRSLGAASSEAEVDAFLGRAFDQDLTSTSAVAESTYALAKRFGFSPLDAEWEVFGQSPEGQVAILALGPDADLAGIEKRLRTLGYTPPADGAGSDGADGAGGADGADGADGSGGVGSGGTWEGSADLVATIDPTLTPVQQNVAVLPDERLVLLSDSPATVTAAAAVVRGDATGLDAAALTSVAGSPVTATLWASDFACSDLAMTTADQEDQRVAASLVERAGGVSPLSGLVMAQQPDRSITVGMLFETSEQASENLQARVDLAAGEAPGQGGAFPDRFEVTSGEADDERVVLQFAPTAAEFVFSDITTGPVLFATC